MYTVKQAFLFMLKLSFIFCSITYSYFISPHKIRWIYFSAGNTILVDYYSCLECNAATPAGKRPHGKESSGTKKERFLVPLHTLKPRKGLFQWPRESRTSGRQQKKIVITELSIMTILVYFEVK